MSDNSSNNLETITTTSQSVAPENTIESEKQVTAPQEAEKLNAAKGKRNFSKVRHLMAQFPRPVAENKGIWKTLSTPPKKITLTVLLTMIWCLIALTLSSMAVLWLPPIETFWQGAWTQPIAYTLQIPVVITLAAFLGRKLGLMTIASYIILGLLGLPVFSNGGGWQYINAPVFGYIVGYLLVPHLVQKESQKAYNSAGWLRGRSLYLLLSGTLAVCLIHLTGCTVLLMHAVGNSIQWHELPLYWGRYSLEPMAYDFIFTLIGLGLVRCLRAACYFALY